MEAGIVVGHKDDVDDFDDAKDECPHEFEPYWNSTFCW